MQHRIVGQCSRTDFRSIEDIIASADDIKSIDTTNWKGTQKVALNFISVSLSKSIPYTMIRELVRGVLVWDNGITIKFMRDVSKIEKVKEFRRLMDT